MAKSKKKSNQTKKSTRSRSREKPELSKSVWSVALAALAALSILSFFDKAGIFGELIKKSLATTVGWGMYFMPVFLFGLALLFILSWEKATNKTIAYSAILFFVSLLGVFAISNYEDALVRGGYLGFAVAWPLIKFFGVVAGFIILVTLAFIAVILGLQVRLDKVFHEFLEKRTVKKSGALEVKIKKTQGQKEMPATSSDKEVASQVSIKDYQEEVEEEKKSAKTKPKEYEIVAAGALGSAAALKNFKLPPLNLLDKETGKPTSGDIMANANIIKRTLQNFGIDVEMGEVNVGPTVTQYTLKPAEGVKLARITALNNDLSLALAAHPIRIEAPIPGRSLVGIEIPNKASSQVRLGSLLAHAQFKETPGNLVFSVGRDVKGAPVYANLSKLPHMLVAGSTGTGKTIALNTILASLLYRNPPQLLRLILIDPKRVEFSVYQDIPHLLAPVITDNNKAVNALKWVVGEMERRFEVLSEAKARDIHVYNNDKKNEPLPFIVVFIDELADLMTSKGREVEALIVRIAQMARAVGIHLVLATQRPSVEIITGLIKANITARIAFQVASQVDSRTILDMAGAEKLLGNGDMLFLLPDKSKPFRVQGAYVDEKEIKRVVKFLREQKVELANENEDLTKVAPERQSIDFDSAADSADDELYEDAKDLVIKKRQASASYLQRRLRIGYARAARLLDVLEENGIVGPADGAKPREVFVSYEEEDEDAELI